MAIGKTDSRMVKGSSVISTGKSRKVFGNEVNYNALLSLLNFLNKRILVEREILLCVI